VTMSNGPTLHLSIVIGRRVY